MAVWIDPLLPQIPTPDDLKRQWFSLGSAKFQLLPKQFQFLKATEEFLGFISGYGGGKTKVGCIKAAYLSMHPGNRGIVGMEASTDLEETAERDLLEFLHEAGLLKKAPTAHKNIAYIHCIDPETGQNLGYESEIQFAHLDDPTHLRGRHVGWAWIDEGSNVKNKNAWQNLLGRLRLPAYRNRYQAYVTGNPNGHNWIYDFFFNQELLEALSCKKHDCPWKCLTSEAGFKACNRNQRLKRRAFHCSSIENYYLPPETLDLQRAGFDDEEWERHIMASFDVLEGQIFKSWREDIHVLAS